MRHSQIWENRFLEYSCLATIKRKCRFCVLAEASLKKKKKKRGKKHFFIALSCVHVLRPCGIVTAVLQIQMEIVFRHQSLHVVVLPSFSPPPCRIEPVQPHGPPQRSDVPGTDGRSSRITHEPPAANEPELRPSGEEETGGRGTLKNNNYRNKTYQRGFTAS